VTFVLVSFGITRGDLEGVSEKIRYKTMRLQILTSLSSLPLLHPTNQNISDYVLKTWKRISSLLELQQQQRLPVPANAILINIHFLSPPSTTQ
jgi:hypothetical protein